MYAKECKERIEQMILNRRKFKSKNKRRLYYLEDTNRLFLTRERVNLIVKTKTS